MLVKRKCTLPQYQKVKGLDSTHNKFQQNRFKRFSQKLFAKPILEAQRKGARLLNLRKQPSVQNKSDDLSYNHYIEKIIKKNIYTLDFFHKSSNKLVQMEDLKTAKTRLIKKSIFQHFKLMNSLNGLYKQAIQQLKQQQQYKQLHLSNQPRLSSISNIEINKDRQKQPTDKNTKLKQKFIRQSINSSNTFGYSKKATMSSMQEITEENSITNYPLTFNKLKNKRKKDPFKNELSKCMQIEKDCLQIQNNKQIQSQIDSFEQYSQQMKITLYRKRHKLQKIKQIQL